MFDEHLLSNDSLRYIYNLAHKSEQMLKATPAKNTKIMAEILKFTHDTESPIFSYKNENKLSAVVKYTGKILAIGISYDKKGKKHSCKIEEL